MKHRLCIWKICFENLGRKQRLLHLKRDSINILQQVFLPKGQHLLGDMWLETCPPRSQCPFLKHRPLFLRDTRIFAQPPKGQGLDSALPQLRLRLKIRLEDPNEGLERHIRPVNAVDPSTRSVQPPSATTARWIFPKNSNLTNLTTFSSWKHRALHTWF